jgi:CspA family cold shock protein
MSTGQVKWFNNAKGFGFILPDGGGGDLFAHYSAIGMDGYKTLKAGQIVTFDKIEGPKGLHAANIKAADDSETSVGEVVENSANEAASAEEAVIASAATIEAPAEEPAVDFEQS